MTDASQQQAIRRIDAQSARVSCFKLRCVHDAASAQYAKGVIRSLNRDGGAEQEPDGAYTSASVSGSLGPVLRDSA